MAKNIIKVLVVCMGNICRSPTGEVVLRAKAARLGCQLEVDSAGTIDYHQGATPDSRAQTTGVTRGYDFSGIKARPIVADDFAYFDYILAADKHNLADLTRQCPTQYRHKLKLYLEFGSTEDMEIPDPYYGGENGFEVVLDLIEDASDGFITYLQETTT